MARQPVRSPTQQAQYELSSTLSIAAELWESIDEGYIDDDEACRHQRLRDLISQAHDVVSKLSDALEEYRVADEGDED